MRIRSGSRPGEAKAAPGIGILHAMNGQLQIDTVTGAIPAHRIRDVC